MNQSDLRSAVPRSEEFAELYRLIAETIPQIVWTAQPDGAVDFNNARALEYAGLDAGRLEGKGWEDVVHPDDLDACRNAWAEAVASGEPFSIEYRLRRAKDGAWRWHLAKALPLRDRAGRIVKWFGTATDIDDQKRAAELLEAHDFEFQRIDERGETIWMSASGVPFFDEGGRFRGYRGIGRNVTGRKRAELELRQTSERYQVLVDSIDGIVWEADPASFAFLFVSRQAERLLGYPARQWIEEADFWRKHTHPEDVGWAAEYCLRATAEKRNHEFEYRMIAADGRTVWLRDLVTVVLEDDQVVKLRGVMVDITARKRTDQALRDSVERFRALNSLSSDFFWETDSAHRFLMVEYQGPFLGPMPPADYIGKTRWEIPYVSPDADGWRRHREMLDAHRPIRGFALARHAQNGEVRHFEVDGDPRFDGGGNFLGYRGVGRDMSERLRAERALRESEQRFQMFMDGSPTLAWIKDAKLRYVFVNRAHQATHGVAPERMLGRDDFQIWPEPTARMLRASDEAALASEEPIERTEMVPKADGGDGHWLVVKFAMPDCSGGRGVAGIAVDITGRIAAERELAQFSARIRVLLKRLTDTQEAERRSIAADLHDLVGQSLTALGVRLATLRAGMAPQKSRGETAKFDDLTELLNETMDALRQVMSDLRPPLLDDYGLRAALEHHACQFAQRAGVPVTVEGPEILPRPAPEIELALFRIAQEALANAAKHAGASRVRVGLARVEGAVRLAIEDDGAGFTLPVRASAGSQSGWGLPLMHERAEAIGGTLHVESSPGGTHVIAEVPHADSNRPG